MTTKWELFRWLAGEYPLPRHWKDSSGADHYGTITAVEREDGRGHSFNVTIRPAEGGNPETFHLRTSD